MSTAFFGHERAAVPGGTRFALSLDGQPLPYAKAMTLLARDAGFRQYLTDLLAQSRYPAFRWETPAVTRGSAERRFEFVLINSPQLAAVPEPEAFSAYFAAAPPAVDILAIPNLGNTATLIVPRQLGEARTGAHLAAFVRAAPPAQVHRLWQCVAETLQASWATGRCGSVPLVAACPGSMSGSRACRSTTPIGRTGWKSCLEDRQAALWFRIAR